MYLPGKQTKPGHPARESLSFLLNRVGGYDTTISQCPYELIDEILAFFPDEYGLYVDREKYTQYIDRAPLRPFNGLIHVGGQGIIIKCVNTPNSSEEIRSYAQWMLKQKKIALKIARPYYNPNVVKSGKPADFYTISIPDQRFLVTTQIQSFLEHEAANGIKTFRIPRIYFSDSKPAPHVGMEWIESFNVLYILKEKKFPEKLSLFLALLDAAMFLHEKGVIHRDFKQENIVIDTSEKLVLLDFGLAKYSQGTSVTLAGTALGTLPYASPKMLYSADNAGEQDDIYALGYVFWEFLNAQKCPELDVDMRGAEGREQYRLTLAKSLPPNARGIFFDATATDENRRYSDVTAFRNAIEKLLKALNYKILREDNLNTELEIKVPESPVYFEQKCANIVQPAPPQKPKKMKGLTSKFLPATFEIGVQEEKEILESLEEKKKMIYESSCKLCKYPSCKGRGICNYILDAMLICLDETFLKE